MPDQDLRFAWPVRVQKGTDEQTLRFPRAGRHFVRKRSFYDDARAELAICVAGARPEGDGRANLTICTRRPPFRAKTFILRRCQSRIGDLSGQCEEKRKKAEGPQFGWLPHLRHRPSGALTPDTNNTKNEHRVRNCPCQCHNTGNSFLDCPWPRHRGPKCADGP